MKKAPRFSMLPITLIIVILVSGCVAGQTTLNLSLNQVSIFTPYNECENLAKEMVPSELCMIKLDKFSIPPFVYEKDVLTPCLGYVWEDGTGIRIQDIEWAIFKKGSEKGQNVNYYYLEGYTFPELDYTIDNSFSYSENVVDKDGNILGQREFKIIPVLKPIGEPTNFLKELKKVAVVYNNGTCKKYYNKSLEEVCPDLIGIENARKLNIAGIDCDKDYMEKYFLGPGGHGCRILDEFGCRCGSASETQLVEIIDMKFISCHWVKDPLTENKVSTTDVVSNNQNDNEYDFDVSAVKLDLLQGWGNSDSADSFCKEICDKEPLSDSENLGISIIHCVCELSDIGNKYFDSVSGEQISSKEMISRTSYWKNQSSYWKDR